MCLESPNGLGNIPRDSRQVLAVKAGGDRIFDATVAAWENSEYGWRQAFPPVYASIGRSGVTAAERKTEGDGCSPAGVYRLGLVFGSEAFCPTAMPYRQATGEDYWVDDPASPDYNRWVSGRAPDCSFERLLRPDGLYRYSVVVEYNTFPVIAGKGSAIFVHLGKPGEPTSGCVGLAEEDLLRILGWLDPGKNPVIAIE